MAGLRERRPLVIGYGNTLRRDDGVGFRAADLLQQDPRLGGVDVLAVHQLTPELALDIGIASLVVFIDADAAAEPGAVDVQPVTPSSTQATTGSGASSHHVGAADLLALAAALGGGSPSAWSVAIGVDDLGMGEGLSPAVEAALPGVLAAVVAAVRG